MKTNYINCCDNVEGLQKLPADCIDLTVTSPPYDNLRYYNGFCWNAEELIVELHRVTKPGGVVVWIVNDATVNGSETCSSFKQALLFRDAGFNLHDTMIWRKPNTPFPSSVRYYACFEYMFIFSNGKPKSVNLIADRINKHVGKRIGATERQPDGTLRVSNGRKMGRRVKPVGVRHNVWDAAAAAGQQTGHPAVFPVQLIADHIISWSNPGDLVLDPFMGSGTTAVAAIKTGRNYIGFECSAEYCEIAEKRIKEEQYARNKNDNKKAN